MTKTNIATLGLTLLLSNPLLADDQRDILDTIERLTSGVDTQNGDLLRQAFREDAAVFATNPSGDGIISLTADTFAQLHADKRFGGAERSVSVGDVDITDGLTAQAKVVAQNAELHYTYYLSFVKLEGVWKIQSFLQRSRPTAVE